jgi:hypothetical protein
MMYAAIMTCPKDGTILKQKSKSESTPREGTR